MASNFAGSKSKLNGLRVGCNVGGLPKA